MPVPYATHLLVVPALHAFVEHEESQQQRTGLDEDSLEHVDEEIDELGEDQAVALAIHPDDLARIRPAEYAAVRAGELAGGQLDESAPESVDPFVAAEAVELGHGKEKNLWAGGFFEMKVEPDLLASGQRRLTKEPDQSRPAGCMLHIQLIHCLAIRASLEFRADLLVAVRAGVDHGVGRGSGSFELPSGTA